METIAVYLMVFTALPRLVVTKRVLLVPVTFHYSHVSKHVAIGESLAKLGHDVTLAVGNDTNIKKISTNTNISVLTYNMPPQESLLTKDKALVDMTIFEVLGSFSDAMKTLCDEMVSDENFIKQVNKTKYDMMVIDGVPFSRCLVLLPKLLNVPFVAEDGMVETHMAGAPFIPSTHPMTLFALGPYRTFVERLMAMVEALFLVSSKYLDNSTWLIEKHLPQTKETNFGDLSKDAEFWLFGNSDPLLEYGLISSPNMAHVGGITTEPAKKLPEDLETFMSAASVGVIVVSFGSFPIKFSGAFINVLLNAFAQVNLHNVIMKVTEPGDFKPSPNVRLEKWLPQNDLLGHPNTKLFITHCGGNGQYEALYHGVPMVGIPVTRSDQQYNAKRMEMKGYGIGLDSNTLTTEIVLKAIKSVLNDPSYRENINKASFAYRNTRMTPRQRAAYWIDYVMNHGGSHLRPPSLDMLSWQYLMLDMVLVFFVWIVSVLYGMIFCLRKLYWMCIAQYVVTHRAKSD